MGYEAYLKMSGPRVKMPSVADKDNNTGVNGALVAWTSRKKRAGIRRLTVVDGGGYTCVLSFMPRSAPPVEHAGAVPVYYFHICIIQ